MSRIFITGTGTGVGKTLVAAIVTQALAADYWKPVQAGISDGTDSDWVRAMVTHPDTRVHPEWLRLKMAASPHIAAREEGLRISLEELVAHCPQTSGRLVIEGAGGLMVPLNEKEFVIDLIRKLEAKVIIVSRHYLGSINHSLLTAAVLKEHKIPVLGWIFNDQYLDYGNEIVNWTGYPAIASIPRAAEVSVGFVAAEAARLKETLSRFA